MANSPGGTISRSKADAVRQDFLQRCAEQVRQMDTPEFVAEVAAAAQTGDVEAVREILQAKVDELDENAERFAATAIAEINADAH